MLGRPSHKKSIMVNRIRSVILSPAPSLVP